MSKRANKPSDGKKQPMSTAEYRKLIESLGGKNGHKSSRAGGGVAIAGCQGPPARAERKGKK